MPSVTKDGYDGSDLGQLTKDRRHKASKQSLLMLLRIRKSGEKMTSIVKEFFLRNFFKNSFIGYGQMRTMLF